MSERDLPAGADPKRWKAAVIAVDAAHAAFGAAPDHHVLKWDVHVERDFPRYEDDPEPAIVRVVILAEFYQDAAAMEFEAEVRALLPDA